MDLKKTTINIRQRTNWEAIDLGLVFIHNFWKKIYITWFIFTFPFFLLITILNYFFIGYSIIAILFLWLIKPVFERIPLFICSRTLFNDKISFKMIFKKLPFFLFKNILLDITLRRFSPWRTYSTPIRILEGLKGRKKRRRVNILLKENKGSASLLTISCILFEIFVFLGWFFIINIAFFQNIDVVSLLFNNTPMWTHLFTVFLYYISFSLISPFFAASGFSLYINRRVFLEGWDIELMFRRMANRFKSISKEINPKPGSSHSVIVIILFLLISSFSTPHIYAQQQIIKLDSVEQKEIIFQKVDIEIKDIFEQLKYNQNENKIRWKLKDKWKNNQEQDKPENVYLNDLFSSIASFIASLLPWILGILFIGVLIFIIVKNDIVIFKGNTNNLKSKQIKSSLETIHITNKSLPLDIIKNAKTAWNNNCPIDALSLIYRGALSYLINNKNILIPESTTERENLKIAGAKLRPSKTKDAFLIDFSNLIKNWQKCAYANRYPNDLTFYNICEKWNIYFNKMQVE